MSAWPVSFSARTAPLPKPAAFSCLPSISHIFISGDERSPLMAGFVREVRIGFVIVHFCAKDAGPAVDSFCADTNGLISVAWKHE
jgi:hypothetical protein